ncbi:hypothetical protein GCM10023321_65700 [Pseudonocardia eucalypti]|uniref:Uncharacterized protein n=1 Tax=Pseudonocardia eucalypti TaxID=648755 RepID=A0ABP9R080_9PSEU
MVNMTWWPSRASASDHQVMVIMRKGRRSRNGRRTQRAEPEPRQTANAAPSKQSSNRHRAEPDAQSSRASGRTEVPAPAR